jgi:hypothetical protein
MTYAEFSAFSSGGSFDRLQRGSGIPEDIAAGSNLFPTVSESLFDHYSIVGPPIETAATMFMPTLVVS